MSLEALKAPIDKALADALAGLKAQNDIDVAATKKKYDDQASVEAQTRDFRLASAQGEFETAKGKILADYNTRMTVWRVGRDDALARAAALYAKAVQDAKDSHDTAVRDAEFGLSATRTYGSTS